MSKKLNELTDYFDKLILRKKKMVKLKIRNEVKDEAVKIPELEFYLELKDGNLVLRMVNNDSSINWDILEITPKGKFRLYASLPDDIGLQVNEDGYILEEKENG